MKSIKTFFALCCAMFIGALYAANETPMQLFKTLREAAINNDTATALQLTGGELLVKIKDEGTFPGDLRQNLLFIKAAFEDIHVRLANPATAEIHAFYLLNGKMEYLNIKLEQNENSVMKIISMTKTQYTAEPFLKKFLEACHTNSIAQYRDMITPELAQQHKTIPNSFKASVQETITPGKSDSNSAVFTVDRSGIKGNIKMVKNGYFWKAASIDAILIALLPAQIVENFSNAAKSTRNVDELKEFLLSGGSAVKKLNEQEISRFAGLSSIDKQTPIGRNKYNLDAKISSETETGTISVELVFEDKSWKIANFNSSLVFEKQFAPAAIVERFIYIAVKAKDLESDNAKSVIPENLLSKLGTQITEPSPELTFNIEKETISGKRASITVSVNNSKVVEKIDFSLVLDAAKWKIQNVTLVAPAPEKENPGNGEISTHE